MSEAESKRTIEQLLRAFATQPLKAAATGLFIALGYASKKTLDPKPKGLEGFCAMFDADRRLNRKQALGGDPFRRSRPHAVGERLIEQPVFIFGICDGAWP